MKDDAHLIEQTLAGDSTAFEQLVRKYQDRLFNTMVHVAGGRDDAQDVVQDAFVQAFVRLESFQRSSAFYTWLYRIAFNVSASQRRRKRPVVSVDETRRNTGREPIDNAAGPVERAEQQERHKKVHEAIASLGEEHRKVVVLREIDGCSYETIAQVLDLPVGTVRSRLHRARVQLKEQLQRTIGD